MTPLEAELAPRGRGVPRLRRRPLWRAAGFVGRLPRWSGSAAAIGFLSLTVVYGIVLGGYGRLVSDSLLSASGLGIETVKLSGQRQTGEKQILNALQIGDGASLALFDAGAARDRLTKIAWIKSASVMKLYPHTLQVVIEEKVPYALWQHGNTVSIVNQSGDVITDEVDGRYADLLLVVNDGANVEASEIVNALKTVPSLRARVHAAFLIGHRRWDILLENGVRVKLPGEHMDEALAELVDMDRKTALLSKDITSVDMRLADRVAVRLSDEAVARRNAELKEAGVLVGAGGRT